MSKFIKQKNNGFTLVETLVAISIFTVSILGLISILASGISNTTYAKQKLTAEYLAQEGIETVRNMRDTYVLYTPATGWSDFINNLLTAQCDKGPGCYMYHTNMDFSAPAKIRVCDGTPIPCPNVRYDTLTGIYDNWFLGTGTQVDSGFSRKIVLVFDSATEVRFTSTVSWKQNSGNFSVTFSEVLFNWIE